MSTPESLPTPKPLSASEPLSTPESFRRPSLTQIAHQHLREAVQKWRTRHTEAAGGAALLAVDATAGNGHDTLFLAQLLGQGGQVAAFDIQPQALEKTAERLRQYRERVGNCPLSTDGQTAAPPPLPATDLSSLSAAAPSPLPAVAPPSLPAIDLPPPLSQVRLIEASHGEMLAHLPAQWQEAVCAITFNLGYLPGADKALVTLADSTLQALDAALQLLAPDGLLSVLCYRGHPEGKIETDAIAQWLRGLPASYSHSVIQAAVDAPPHAPLLLQIERILQST